MNDRLQSAQFNRHYVRVGEVPKGERSANYVTGKREKGVSVYAVDSRGRPVPPDDDEWGPEDLHSRLVSPDPKYRVVGDEVGRGQGGEPLLRNVKVVGNYDPYEHFSEDELEHWRSVYRSR